MLRVKTNYRRIPEDEIDIFFGNESGSDETKEEDTDSTSDSGVAEHRCTMAACGCHKADETEMKMEFDTAEDPSLYWGMIKEQHTHVNKAVRAKQRAPRSRIVSEQSASTPPPPRSRVSPPLAPPLRPTVAMKAPRSVLATAPCAEAKCKANAATLRAKVKVLQAKVVSLEARQLELEGELVTSYASQDVENAPQPAARQKPGCHSPATAAAHHMVELDPGSGVYCYPTHLYEAKQKSGDSVPRYLLSAFYTQKQLAKAGNLSGANGKEGLDKRIVDAIIAYTLVAKEGSSSAWIRLVMRNKVGAAVCKAKQSKSSSSSSSWA